MPVAPSKLRRAAGPWVIIEVPMDDPDPLYPSRRRFYTPDESDKSSEFVDKALHFTSLKDAERKANQIMHTSRNTWAEAIPAAIAWALIYAGGAQWQRRIKPEVPRVPFDPKH